MTIDLLLKNLEKILFPFSKFILLCLFLLFSCQEKQVTPPPDQGIILGEIDSVLANPFMGLVPWVGSDNLFYQTTLQYVNITWRELEPSPGVYRWSVLESGWGNISQTRRRVGFRISTAMPGSVGHIDIPQWLVDQGVRMRAYEIDGQFGLAPDWDDPQFLQAHHDFIAALGARYDSDYRVAWIDIGSYGFWGEWHVYLNDSLAATQASKQAILEAYFSAFPTKPKVIAFDDDFATAYVTNRGGGIRNDCLGTAGSNNWYLQSLNHIDPTLNDRVWKSAFIGGEFCGGEAGALQGTTERFELNYQFIQQTHWSFLGPAGGLLAPENAQHRVNLDKLLKKLGYRFVIRKIEHTAVVNRGEEFSFTLIVENKGVAPFYFNWPLIMYLVGSSGQTAFTYTSQIDIRTWLPGENINQDTFIIPTTLEPAVYQLKIAIHDPGIDKPAIRFANTNRDTQGRYLVSQVQIE